MLFPALRHRVHQFHRHSFRSWRFAYRELTPRELGNFALGWEIVTAEAVTVHYLLGPDAPYGNPTLRVTAPIEARLRWSNVESDGTMCLLEPGQSWMPLLGSAAVDHILHAMKRIIEKNLRAPPPPDPVAARHRWVTSGARVWSLLNPNSRRANAIACRLYRRWVVASTRKELDSWLSRHGRGAAEYVAARFVRVGGFTEVPTSVSSLGIDERKVVEDGGLAVYSVPTDAGPLLVAVRLDTGGSLARTRVDRADRQWVHERGGVGLPIQVAQAHVAIVGCGSLGSGVADLLARAGVGRLTIIDPDTLTWDNVARHVLGGESVGLAKARGLAQRLQTHFPTIPRVIGLPHSWQWVAAERPRALHADLIVSTIAAWPDELALSEWARMQGIPLLLGWVEARAAAGHAVSLQGRCLACHFSPRGGFRGEVAKWEKEAPIRLADGCHDYFLPYGYAEIVPTQSLIARLALEILNRESVKATHRALVPSARTLKGLGARASSDSVGGSTSAPSKLVWAERHESWRTDPNCWHCSGTG